jgi:hypothetical protein
MYTVYYHTGNRSFRSALKALIFYLEHSKIEHTELHNLWVCILPKNLYSLPLDIQTAKYELPYFKSDLKQEILRIYYSYFNLVIF